MAAVILEEVEKWIAQHNRIQFAPLSNGGWERWAQIDFSIYMNSLGTATFLEDPCFAGTAQKADLVVGPQGTTPGAVMELKVLNNGESIAAYGTKLVNDQTKLKQPLTPNRAGYMKCSYGIASSSMLIPLLQAAFPGKNINVGNFEGYLQQKIPSHNIEPATSASGEVFAISFIYID